MDWLDETMLTPASFATMICNRPVWHGDALDVLRKLPEQSVDVVVTSPPYYQQRDYGDARQLGSEPSVEAYVARLEQIFSQIHRVLKPTGALWLNLGDKFLDGALLGVPWRVAIRLQSAGWLLRADVIWHKPNAMPSPVRTRPTVDHEYLFFFAKSREYFYDADAIREPHVTFSEQSRMRGGRKHFGRRGATPERGKNQGNNNLHDGRWDQAFHPLGRNKRTVWSIPLSKSRQAHFAVFPETLVETCLKATCPPNAIVLDPFCGTGTVLAVAKRLGHQPVGIDCIRDYCEMAESRLRASTPSSRTRSLPLFPAE
jgi:site-specific DNA-methyltransferase (adenine-specific)